MLIKFIFVMSARHADSTLVLENVQFAANVAYDEAMPSVVLVPGCIASTHNAI